MTQRNVLSFSVHPNTGSLNYGGKFWAVGLPDGREVYLHADRLAISPTGVLQAWRDTRIDPNDEDRRVDLDESEVLLMLPSGSWVHAYAASVIDGSPVVVDHLDAPEDY